MRRYSACAAIALFIGLTGCAPSDPSPDFALPEVYRVNGMDIPAAPCDTVVESANKKPAGSYQRRLSANLALELSAVISAYASDDLARASLGDRYSADNPWGFDDDDRRFMESGDLERICEDAYDPNVAGKLDAALKGYGAFGDTTYIMMKPHMVTYEPS